MLRYKYIDMGRMKSLASSARTLTGELGEKV